MAEPTVTETVAAADATSTAAAATTLLGADATQTPNTPAIAPVTPAAATEKPAPPPVTPETPAAATEVKPVPGAPEKYEFKAPAGTEYDASILSAFEAGARDANLTQESAQKLLETMSPQIAARQAEQVASIRTGWYDASKADKEFGGVALEQNLGIAKKALDSFGSPELHQLLTFTGLGNHPEIIRFMYKAGKSISQDNMITGSAPTRGRVNAAMVLYDKTTG
jgi:hypothetical protein